MAKGDYILFVDADTKLEPDCINRSLDAMKDGDLDVLSSIPFHRNESLLEKSLAPFHLFLLAVTKPFF